MADFDLRPRLGQSSGKNNRRLLFVCFFDPVGITTVYENIALWQHFSRYNIEVLNLWPNRGGTLAIPAAVDIDGYAGVIIHCTASYSPDNLYTLDNNLRRPFEQFDGVKVLMKQDEHYHSRACASYIGKKKIDLVITCVGLEERGKVYPPELVGDAMFLQAFTGYVSPYMRSLVGHAAGARALDIAYRGSIQPLSFGRLGFEKRKIGYDVAREAARYPITVDISSRSQDRIGGTAWFDFLARSRAVLGVESGTNLFDFTGEVEAWCTEFIRRHPAADHSSEQFYKKADREFLHLFEGNVNYAQISPRHFEAAAARSLQILYEGKYSGVFTPYRHYLPLRRDLANLDEIIDAVRDDRRHSEITDCAFDEIICNPQFQYEAFVAGVDQAIDRLLASKGQKTSAAGAAVGRARPLRALILAAHDPTIDPRIEWMAEGLSAQFEVCELGACPDEPDTSEPSCERVSARRMRLRVGRRRHDWPGIPGVRDLTTGSSASIQHLMLLYTLAEMPAKALARAVGALDATDQDLARFRWLARHFLHCNNALLQAARLTGQFDAIIAADLDTLPAALILAQESSATVLYDAHEFWPQAFPEFRHWEIEFWSGFERNLAPLADLRATVSPHLAQLMSKEYGCEFLHVSNCVSRRSAPSLDIEAALARLAARDEVVFIFLGGFAAGRGIEDLIAAWAFVDKRAQLILQGPNGDFRTQMIALAQSYGLLDNGVRFPDAVPTNELITAARAADIGIIPYAPSSINNKYCSPNKLSQYMAAGLPIICNDTEFVKQIVLENRLGVCIDFRDHRALAKVVDRLVNAKEEIAETSRRSRQYFETQFNWEIVSAPLYDKLLRAVDSKPVPIRHDLDFSWVANGGEMRAELSGDGFSVIPNPQIELLTKEIERLNTVYSAEIARLNEVYPAEIGRLQGQIRLLNEVYPAEFARLNREIAHLQQLYPSEIARLNQVYPAEIVHLHQVYQKEIARLNTALGHLGGRYRWRSRLNRLLTARRVRAMARIMISWLPERLRSPIKSRLIMVLGRL